jgi:2-iminobutanoate/2-iminopropanoate deaminase
VLPSLIFVSGQIPAQPSGELIQGSMGEKTSACIRALKAILEEAGSSLDKVVKVQVFLTDMKDFAEMNEEYGKWFTTKPARSCVAVHQLPKGVNVEIECIAVP